MNILQKIINKIGGTKPIQPTTGTVIADVGGFKMKLDLNEYIDSSIFKKDFEQQTVLAFKKLCKSNDTVLDIGANIGFYSFHAANLIGKKGKVYAFEPTEYAYNKFMTNASLNKFENIALSKIALSDSNGSETLEFNSSWPLDNKNTNLKAEQLTLETLDNFVKRNNISDINFIKIDVDGYEYKILKGATQTLKSHNPYIILELCGYTLKNNGSSLMETVNLVKELGYNLFNEYTFEKYSNEEIEKNIFQNTDLMTSSINVILSKSNSPILI